MARAKVVLKEAVSYTIKGRVWKKKQPQILTDPKEIEFYRANSRFSVTDLKEPGKSAAATTAAPAPKVKATSTSGGSSRGKSGGGDD